MEKILTRIWIILIVLLVAAAVLYFIREGNPKSKPLTKEHPAWE